jgi:hypothetical protein
MLDLVSGILMLVFTDLFLNQFFPTLANDSIINSDALKVLAKAFGGMCITLGLVQCRSILEGSVNIRKYFIIGLALGDAFHFYSSILAVPDLFQLSFGTIFSLANTVLLFSSRVTFLIIGIPTNESS